MKPLKKPALGTRVKEDRQLPDEAHKAWASGRVLTASQRERKREKDRLSHKKTRDQSQKEVAALRSQIELLTTEVERLKRNSQLNWSSLSQPSNQIPHTYNTGTTPDVAYTNTSECFVVAAEVAMPPADTAQTSDTLDSEVLTNTSSPTTNKFDFDTDACHDIDIAPSKSSLLDRSFERTCQEIFNSLIQQAMTSTWTSNICIDETLNDNFLIRGVVNGWDNFHSSSSQSCPLWETIRKLDDHIFCESGLITRLCTLKMIHLMLLCLAGMKQFSSLPTWYRPRPSQFNLPHPLAVDVLPWPGLRERAVHSSYLTETNRFWNDVIYCFHFNWPYPLQEAFSLDSSTALLKFSGLFQNSVRDIRLWRMKHSFFESFPETFEDIAPIAQIEWPIGGMAAVASPLKRYHYLAQSGIASLQDLFADGYEFEESHIGRQRGMNLASLDCAT